MALREWVWRLDEGVTIRATLEPSSMVQSVYVERRLVSRSTPGGPPKDHLVALSAVPGGAYRGVPQATVTFEVAEAILSARLTIDGKVVAATSSDDGFTAGEEKPWLGSSLVYDGAMIAIGAIVTVVGVALLAFYLGGVAGAREGTTVASSRALFLPVILGVWTMGKGMMNLGRARGWLK